MTPDLPSVLHIEALQNATGVAEEPCGSLATLCSRSLAAMRKEGLEKKISELDDMACASLQVVFPITGWENNLAVVPLLSEQRILESIHLFKKRS